MLLAALLAGCAGTAKSHNTANRTAPGLTDDAPTHGRGGTNPNAPFTLIDRTPRAAAHLASMTARDASPCTGKELELTEVSAEMNGNDHTVKFAFVNKGPEACRIGGYPSIDLLDEENQPLATITVEQTGKQTLDAQTGPATAIPDASAGSPQIVLDPHGEAYFGVSWTTGDDCPVVSKFGLTAPDTAESYTVSRPIRVCSGRVHVTALRSTQGAS
jgi:hypothetical protein